MFQKMTGGNRRILGESVPSFTRILKIIPAFLKGWVSPPVQCTLSGTGKCQVNPDETRQPAFQKTYFYSAIVSCAHSRYFSLFDKTTKKRSFFNEDLCLLFDLYSGRMVGNVPFFQSKMGRINSPTFPCLDYWHRKVHR